MLRPTFTRHLVTCIFYFFTGFFTGFGQETETGALKVLRSQIQTQAEGLALKLQVARVSRLRLIVNGSINAEFTFNAFLETLTDNGLVISSSEQGTDGVLEVTVLAQGISYDGPVSETWKQTARTAFEARLRRTSSEIVEYLGNFDISRVDLVSQKEEGWWVRQDDALLVGSAPGALEKILIPISIIAATAVVVYLFFTVRN